jgi:hypothetical protein
MADAPIARPHSRTAPTWLWASVGGLVQPRSTKKGDNEQCCSISFLGSEIEPIGTDPFGALKSAKLFISGCIIPGKLVHGNSTGKFVPCYIEINGQAYGIHLNYAAEEPGPDFLPSGTKVVCMKTGVHSSYGSYNSATSLVLHCIDEENNIYEHIGTVSTQKNVTYSDWFGRSAQRDLMKKITLV